MINSKDVEKLASLARIKLEENQKEELISDISSILEYIDQIKEASLNIDHSPVLGDIYNILREDKVEMISDEDRNRIIKSAPDKEGDFIAVRQVFD